MQPFLDLRLLAFEQVVVTRQVPIGYFEDQRDVELRFCDGLEDHLLRLRDDWVLEQRHHGLIQRDVQRLLLTTSQPD